MNRHNVLQPNTLNMIFDGQFGSTGKGVIAGYMAKIGQTIDLAITNAAPNAGHTVDFDDGRGRMITFHLPVSALWDDKTEIYLCAGSIIDPVALLKECETLGVDPSRITIHPHAAVLEDEDREYEKQTTSSVTKIASTQKGVGSALARKIMRRGNVAKFNEILQRNFKVEQLNVSGLLKKREGYTALMEIPQGFGLGVNNGFYPYTTCRDISVMQGLSDVAVHPSLLGRVMMTLRTFPIRVGNIVDEDGKEIGFSGPFFPDSQELSWESLGQEPERTTVTKRIRRVATFSLTQYSVALRVNRPDFVFLNFCNYFPEPGQLRDLLHDMKETGKLPTHLGIGPTTSDVIEVVSNIESVVEEVFHKLNQR